MKNKLLIVGGKGSGEIAMSIFQDMNKVKKEWDIEGYLTDIKNPGEKLGYHNVVGSTSEMLDFVNKGYYIHNTLYINAKEKKDRVERFNKLNIPLEANATGIHPTSIVSPGVKIGHGVLINQFALLQVNCFLQNFIHVYSGSLIGHETYINSFSTIGAHSIIGGRVIIEQGVHVGLNVSIREDLKIGEYSILGMGSVVIKNVKNNDVIAGNPAESIL